jgi:hypothetical protein
VGFWVAGKQAALKALDDGAGFPASFDPLKLESHGLVLEHNVNRWDLHGEVAVGNRVGRGGRVSATFPIDVLDPPERG